MTTIVGQELTMKKPHKVDSGKTRRTGSPGRPRTDRTIPSILDSTELEDVWENIEEAVDEFTERAAEPIDFPHGHDPDEDDAPEEGMNEITRAAESIPADTPADRADRSAEREEHPPAPPNIDDVLDKDLMPDPADDAPRAGKHRKR
ncbi:MULTISPECIES: hypothetical protein [unclassified Cupriavidus]|uniref:hypothetical protein n=1 Tax=Cupriavidus TaxID=106589 RepID=UPI002270597A|nr:MULTISPECIES: hypothetical protein [unclassified Cupriavidus]MCY0854572.1 hypothetical protein [Cupriavidus sp. D39]MDW3686735.1 hypothetical protein [Cupriavidus sp. CV2]